MSSNPTAAYRAQQGMAPVTQSYDPKVVSWIVQAAKQTGADPTALLATAIQESGARTGAVGDNGTSFGPFQMHRGGALGAHNAAWANSYDAVLNRAQQFAADQVHHGKGAAAVQRPLDQSLYAQGVDSHYQQAKAILAHYGLKMPAAPAATPSATPAESTSIPGSQLVSTLIGNNDDLAHIPGTYGAQYASTIANANPFQGLIDSNSKLAGINSITLPTPPTILPTTPTPSAPKNPTPTGPMGKVITGAAKIIGNPYQGTHAVAFNKAGGSNNWESENAVDIAMPKGTPIYAPTSGVIGSQIGSLGSGGRFAGLRVHLAGGGQQFYFAHLSKLAVKAGQKVQAGQIIGYSGVANGVAHLHLAVIKGNPGAYA